MFSAIVWRLRFLSRLCCVIPDRSFIIWRALIVDHRNDLPREFVLLQVPRGDPEHLTNCSKLIAIQQGDERRKVVDGIDECRRA
jgi:hypothetical protein